MAARICLEDRKWQPALKTRVPTVLAEDMFHKKTRLLPTSIIYDWKIN
jgi:hypothetical protein